MQQNTNSPDLSIPINQKDIEARLARIAAEQRLLRWLLRVCWARDREVHELNRRHGIADAARAG